MQTMIFLCWCGVRNVHFNCSCSWWKRVMQMEMNYRQEVYGFQKQSRTDHNWIRRLQSAEMRKEEDSANESYISIKWRNLCHSQIKTISHINLLHSIKHSFANLLLIAPTEWIFTICKLLYRKLSLRILRFYSRCLTVCSAKRTRNQKINKK